MDNVKTVEEALPCILYKDHQNPGFHRDLMPDSGVSWCPQLCHPPAVKINSVSDHIYVTVYSMYDNGVTELQHG